MTGGAPDGIIRRVLAERRLVRCTLRKDTMNRVNVPLPPDLFFDLLHGLTHALELDLDRLSLPEGKLTKGQKHALECFRNCVKSHRERCAELEKNLSAQDYEEAGLTEEAERTGHEFIASRYTSGMQEALEALEALEVETMESVLGPIDPMSAN